jgi:hypothetical protein
MGMMEVGEMCRSTAWSSLATHTFKSDEYIFKNAKRKTRSTKKEDWQKITYKGESAWMYDL